MKNITFRKTAKKLLFLLAIMTATIPALYAQTDIAQQAGSEHQMLRPDEKTSYADETGHTIDRKQFAAAMQTGKYSFQPEMEDGRIKSIQLKKSGKGITAGEPAPDFSLTDINGKRYSLKSLRGRTVVLNFWFTACMPCVQEIPDLNGLVKKYEHDTNVVFLAITYENMQTVKKFTQKKDFKYNIVADGQTILNQFGIISFPTSIVIDKTGGIAFLLSSNNNTNAAQLDGVIGALK